MLDRSRACGRNQILTLNRPDSVNIDVISLEFELMCKELIAVTETEASTIISWDNRQVPIDGCLAVFMGVFTAIWLTASIAMCYDKFANAKPEPSLFVVIVVSSLSFLIPFLWFINRTRETIEISSEFYNHFFSKFAFFRKKRWRCDDIKSVHIGFFRATKPKWLWFIPGKPDVESNVTLNVFGESIGKRDMIAWWLRPDIKYEIFKHIRTAAIRHQLDWKFENSAEGLFDTEENTRDNKAFDRSRQA